MIQEEGKMKVLITGAARGLGAALTEKFSSEGHMVLAAVRNCEKAEQLRKLAEERENVLPVVMDVESWPSIEKCAEEVRKKTDTLDLLINNAGVLFDKDRETRLMQVDPEVLRRTLAVNVEGPILVTKAFYPFLEKSEHPRVYTITSESSIRGNWYGMPVYSLSKVAAGKAMGILSVSVGEKWQVLAVHPGRMDTDMGRQTAQIPPETAAEGIYRMAEGRIRPQSWYVNYLGEEMEA